MFHKAVDFTSGKEIVDLWITENFGTISTA